MLKHYSLGFSFIEILISLWIVGLSVSFTLGLQKSLNTQQNNNRAYVGALSLFNNQFSRVFDFSTLHVSLPDEIFFIGQTKYKVKKEIKPISILGQNMSAIKISIYWLDFNAQEKQYSLTKLSWNTADI
ncbi:hypothetical protein JI57_03470 [Psychromonas sp. PRT-SC03]|nr:hypothetical protein JI57_03470 [Psychromonas sp. PRT-SC03]